MIARGLQRLEAQDCERWRLGCKKTADLWEWETAIGLQE